MALINKAFETLYAFMFMKIKPVVVVGGAGCYAVELVSSADSEISTLQLYGMYATLKEYTVFVCWLVCEWLFTSSLFTGSNCRA